MATKKKTTRAATRRNASAPAWSEWERLIGTRLADVPPADRDRFNSGGAVFLALLRAVRSPTERSDRWLHATALGSPLWPSTDERRASLLASLQGYLDTKDRAALDTHLAGMNVTRAQLDAALEHLRGEREIASVAARLSLASGWLDDKREPGESHGNAVKRIAKTYRRAWERVTKHT